MAGTSIIAGICTSTYPSLYSIEKVRDSPYPYPVNAGISCQNGDGFAQYPWGQVRTISMEAGLFAISNYKGLIWEN